MEEDKEAGYIREAELERQIFAANPEMWVEIYGDKSTMAPNVNPDGSYYAESPEELLEIAEEMERQGWVPGT